MCRLGMWLSASVPSLWWSIVGDWMVQQNQMCHALKWNEKIQTNHHPGCQWAWGAWHRIQGSVPGGWLFQLGEWWCLSTHGRLCVTGCRSIPLQSHHCSAGFDIFPKRQLCIWTDLVLQGASSLTALLSWGVQLCACWKSSCATMMTHRLMIWIATPTRGFVVVLLEGKVEIATHPRP